MTADTASGRNKASLARRILGSFLAAFVGWVPLNLILVIIGLIDWRRTSVTGWSTMIAFASMSAKFIFATWLILLLPLYLLIPVGSVLWRWPVCTLCGALCGGLIQFSFWRWYGAPFTIDEVPSLIGAGFIGAIACLFGSLTAPRFHFARST
jgi:hypothetical protein